MDVERFYIGHYCCLNSFPFHGKWFNEGGPTSSLSSKVTALAHVYSGFDLMLLVF